MPSQRKHFPSVAVLLSLGLSGCCSCLHGPEEVPLPRVSIDDQGGRVVILAGFQPVAEYFYRDPEISRPYFAHVHAPCGEQVTRRHPPGPGDATDHRRLHPGIWMAFGDLGGADDWRLKAKVESDGLVGLSQEGDGRGVFTVRNRYLSADGSRTICTETCKYTILVRPKGYLLIWDSTFVSDTEDFYFSETMDEMGLAFRVATPIVVKSRKGGRILDSKGRVNEVQVREELAEWCDYSGTVNGKAVGLMIAVDPSETPLPWWHARDYGFLAANPFRSHPERLDFTRVVVKKGEPYRIRFGVWIHGDGSDEPFEPRLAYEAFLRLARDA